MTAPLTYPERRTLPPCAWSSCRSRAGSMRWSASR